MRQNLRDPVAAAPSSGPTRFVPARASVLLGRLRSLTRAHLALSTRPGLSREGAALVESIRPVLDSLFGGGLRLVPRLLPSTLVPTRALGRFSSFALLELSAQGASAALEVERSSLVALLGALSGRAPGASTPASTLTSIEEAAFAFLCLECLAVARASELVEQQLAPRLLSVTDDVDAASGHLASQEPHVAVELHWELAGLVGRASGPRGRARLWLPASVLSRAAHALPREAPAPIHAMVAAARLSLGVVAGEGFVQSADVSRLESGDVVLLSGLERAEGVVRGRARLVAQGFELRGQLGEQGFELASVTPRPGRQEESMERQAGEQVSGPPPIPVSVEVELTRVQLSISELGALRPGAVIPLRIDGTEPVLLRIGDRAVALAELVELEGQVGARVLELLSDGSTP